MREEVLGPGGSDGYRGMPELAFACKRVFAHCRTRPAREGWMAGMVDLLTACFSQ